MQWRAALCDCAHWGSPQGVDLASGSLDDSAGTIADTQVNEGWTLSADLRGGYSNTKIDSRDGSENTSSGWLARLRAGGSYKISNGLVVAGRVATACSSSKCDFDLGYTDSIPVGSSSVDDGDVTVDELYLHTFRRERFDLAIGRLQTKFVARAGVFAKSLDRNDSNGTNITWTDGIHGTMHFSDKSIVHLILQKNQADGTGNVRRAPINFSDDQSRVTYFVAWENLRRIGPINQRGIDLTYLPKSLLKDGGPTGQAVNYLGIVARFAASWPEGSTGPRLNFAGEFGYAPTTPTRAAMGLSGTDDTGGIAWNLSVSGMNLRPNHSIGLNYGRTDAGWLLSPQYRNNEKVLELRYLWRRTHNLAIDIRARWRKDLEILESAVRRQESFNVFARFTLGFD